MGYIIFIIKMSKESLEELGNKVSQEKRDEFKEIFDYFYDKERDNSIPADKLGNVIRALGFNPTETEINDFITEADGENQNNVIEWKDFLGIMYKKMNDTDTVEELQEAFRKFEEKDRPGCIYIHTFRHVMSNMGDK